MNVIANRPRRVPTGIVVLCTGVIAAVTLGLLTPRAQAELSRGSVLAPGGPHAAALRVHARVGAASDSQPGPMLERGYEYKITFSGDGELSSSDTNGEGLDDSQAAHWKIVPSQPVQIWVAKFNPPAGTSYTTTASSPDIDPTAGTMIENGHWPDTDGEHAYSCQGPVGVNVDALFAVGLGSVPTIRTDFAGSGMAAGGPAEAVSASPGSCTSMPSYSGIDGMTGFFTFWVPPGFTGEGEPASGQPLAVGAPIPPQDVGRYSFTLLAQDYSQVTDPTACPFSIDPGPSCMPKLQLHGRYDFTEVCAGKVAASAGGSPIGTCSSDKKLQDAAKAANEYLQQEQEDHFNYKVNCTGELAYGFNRDDPGAKGFCLALAATVESDLFEAQHEQQIANDPPDSAYSKVARPKPPQVKGLRELRSALPAAYLLVRRDLQVAGLVRAVTTALNRASGALLALSSGNSTATADIAKQQKAAQAYAGRAAHLLGGRHRLALKAASELRRTATRIRAPRSGHLVSGIRRLASSLVSKRAIEIGRLEIAALEGIGS